MIKVGMLSSGRLRETVAFLDNKTGIAAVNQDGSVTLTVTYTPIINDDVGEFDCWLIAFPTISLKKVPVDPKDPTLGLVWESFYITGTPTLNTGFSDSNLTQSRMSGIFRAFPSGTTAFPPDFDPFDYVNIFQILFVGYAGSIPVSLEESYLYSSSSNTPIVSFPLTAFRTLNDIQDDGVTSWQLEIDAKGVNRLKTVTREDTTFGVAALFAALLSIFNISLTVFALFFPNQPLVVSQTYFRFKEPPKIDPSKLDQKTQEAMVVSRGNSRANSRPASPGPGNRDEIMSPTGDEVAMTLVQERTD